MAMQECPQTGAAVQQEAQEGPIGDPTTRSLIAKEKLLLQAR